LNGESVLTGQPKESALQAALYVAYRLKDPRAAEQAAAVATAQSEFPAFSQWFPPSVAQGNAGLGLLWAYLDSCFPDQGWDAIGKAHLEIAVRCAEQAPSLGTGLFSGLSGLAFAGWQLSRGGTRYRRLLATLDEAITSETVPIALRVRASNGLSVGDFDVISGLSGVGAYLLCRHQQPSAGIALAHTVEALISISTRDQIPPPWHTPAHLLYDDPARETYPHGNLNCGLAHGVPGILAFLALVRLSGLSFERLDQAILTIGDWLCANRLDDEWGVNWPTAVHLEKEQTAAGERLRQGDPGSVPGGPSRTAWCYGSPGVARALWLAGRAINRSDYRELAISAMEAVFRRPIPVRRIDSPTFCHGVAGLLAIVLRFANETGSPAFVEECRKLAQQLLDGFQPGSILGFRNIEYRNNQTDQPGLLDGAAGVAIVLLAASTGVDPAWDRLFLLS
jgi:lantibiotic modifying enzyme